MKKIIVSVFLVSAAFAQTTGTYTVNKLKVKGDATVDGTLSVGSTNPIVLTENTFASNGRTLLNDWDAQIAKITSNTASSQAVIAWFGDSWTANGTILVPLRTYLQDRFGSSGFGWIAASTHDTLQSGGARVTAGTWTDANKTANNMGLDASSSTTTDIATPARKTFSCTATDLVIHYVKQPNGGTFTWAVDGGSTTSVNTADAATAHATTIISGQTNAWHDFAITATVAGSAGVQLLGVECRINQNGVRLHSFGQSGMMASELEGANVTAWEAGLTAAAPNLIVFMFGINESNAGQTAATQAAHLTTLISRARAVLPNASILLASPGDNGTPGSLAMSTYAAAQNALSVTLSAGYIDGLKPIGTYAAANARSLYGNAAHLNAAGGMVLANYMAAYLVPTNASVVDPITTPLVNFVPTASGQSISKISGGWANVNDTIQMLDVDMGQGYGKAYMSWTKSSAQGRRFDLFLPRANGVKTNVLWAEENGFVQGISLGLAPSGFSLPSCNEANRGRFWHEWNGAGVKDTVQICAKAADDSYAWRAIY